MAPASWTAAEQLRLNFPPHKPPNNQRLRLACQVGPSCGHDIISSSPPSPAVRHVPGWLLPALSSTQVLQQEMWPLQLQEVAASEPAQSLSAVHTASQMCCKLSGHKVLTTAHLHRYACVCAACQVACVGAELAVTKRDRFWGQGDAVLGPAGPGEFSLPLGELEFLLDSDRRQQQQHKQ